MTLLKRLGMAAVAILVSGVVIAAEVSLDLKNAMMAANPDQRLPVIIDYRSESNPFKLREQLRSEARRFRRSAVPRTLQAEARAAGERVAERVDALDGRNTRVLWINSSVSAELSPAAINELLADPAIVQIRPDGLLDSPFPMAGAALAPEWNIDAVGVSA